MNSIDPIPSNLTPGSSQHKHLLGSYGACCAGNRRGFITSLVGASLYAGIEGAGALSSSATAAPSDTSLATLIDVHHHVFAPNYLKELESAGLAELPARNW